MGRVVTLHYAMLRSLEARVDQLVAEIDAILTENEPKPRKLLPSPGTATIVGPALLIPSDPLDAASTAPKSPRGLPGA
jgi:hypothetical protein